MKVLHVCYSDGKGGAYIGAYHLHKAMIKQGVDSTLLVVDKIHSEPEIITPYSGWLVKLKRFHKKFEVLICLIFSPSGNKSLRSFNIIPTGLGKIINNFDADITQLHWINSNTISINEIKNINKPLVWKMPDMWVFSGSEHYKLPSDPDRHIEGYINTNRPEHESGIDINRLLWCYKYKKWKDCNLTFVGPSNWLADEARKSKMLRNKRIEHIFNPVDIKIFQPIDRERAKKHFNLSTDKKYLMFCAMNAIEDKRKGYHYLIEALQYLSKKELSSKLEVIIVGTKSKYKELIHGFNVHHFGAITSESEMALAYNMAELIVLPTKLDNLPNVIKEGTACGVPCVGFSVGGIPEMIVHKKTGYLVEPYESRDLAAGIEWVFENADQDMRDMTRKLSCERHDPDIVVKKYLDLYREVINDYKRQTLN